MAENNVSLSIILISALATFSGNYFKFKIDSDFEIAHKICDAPSISDPNSSISISDSNRSDFRLSSVTGVVEMRTISSSSSLLNQGACTTSTEGKLSSNELNEV